MNHLTRTGRRAVGALMVAIAATGVLSACTSSADSSSEVRLITHDSFDLPQNLIKKFEQETGMTLAVIKSGDAGSLSSAVALSSGSPKGDAVFGIDNTFAARAIAANAVVPYRSPEAGNGADDYALVDGHDEFTAIDHGDVCLNVDQAWYDRKGQQAPQDIHDLVKPAFRDQAVLLNPATSSPGMGFLLSTIGTFEGKAPEFWRAAKENGAKIVPDWETAYNREFSAGAGHGDRPIVVSYASSPAATEGTRALLDNCFAQIEYVGVLRGARNAEGAKKLIDFLLSDDVQAALPNAMYVYPVRKGTALPQDWQRRAPAPSWTVRMAPDYIDANRETWLQQWRTETGS